MAGGCKYSQKFHWFGENGSNPEKFSLFGKTHGLLYAASDTLAKSVALTSSVAGKTRYSWTRIEYI
jgi:hypothetical protein